MMETKYLEAVLFSAAKPLPIDMLREVFNLSKKDIEEYIYRLSSELEASDRGIRIRQSAAGVELVSASSCAEYVGHIRKKEDKLSSAAMETLAVIAYKQPITKAEIEEVRGVNSDKVIKQLLSRALIAELGHKDTVGRPILYGTTDEFLRSTGVTSIDELHQEIHNSSADYDSSVPMGESTNTSVDNDDNLDTHEALHANHSILHSSEVDLIEASQIDAENDA